MQEYDDIEALVISNEHTANLELLCNIAQLLFDAVRNQLVSAEEAQIKPRIARLPFRLQELADNEQRPNNALQARTSFLTVEVNNAALTGDDSLLSTLRPKFSEVLAKAEGLSEFRADNLVRMVEVVGMLAGNDPGYRDLVDHAATSQASTRKICTDLRQPQPSYGDDIFILMSNSGENKPRQIGRRETLIR